MRKDEPSSEVRILSLKEQVVIIVDMRARMIPLLIVPLSLITVIYHHFHMTRLYPMTTLLPLILARLMMMMGMGIRKAAVVVAMVIEVVIMQLVVVFIIPMPAAALSGVNYANYNRRI